MSNPLHWSVIGRLWPVVAGDELAAKQFADWGLRDFGEEFVPPRTLEISEA